MKRRTASRSAALRACAGTLALLLAAAAHAQVLLPKPVQLESLVRPLARAGVALPPERVIEIWMRASEAYEQCVLQLLEDQRVSGATAADLGNRPIAGPAEQRRVDALSDRVFAAQEQLRGQLFDELAKAAADPDDRRYIEQLAAIEAVAGAYDRLTEDHERIRSAPPLPYEIGTYLRSPRGSGSDAAAASRTQWRARAELAATHAAERCAAALEARKALMTFSRDQAAQAAAYGTSGKSPDQIYAERNAAISRVIEKAKAEGRTAISTAEFEAATANLPNPFAQFTGAPEAFDRFRRVQLDTYREIESRLSPEQREYLIDYWFSSIAGIDSPPTNIGQLTTPRGYVRVNPWISELLRQPALDEPARERVRTLGRAWLKDDQAIRASALESMLRTGAVTDLQARRTERAARAKREIGAIPGLEFFAEEPVRWPQVSDPLSEADAKEFGDTIRRRPEPNQSSTLTSARTGLPVDYREQDQRRLAEILELDDVHSTLFAQVMDRAREEWRAHVEPLMGERTKQPRLVAMVMTMEESRALLAAERSAQQARDEAWTRAASVDASALGAAAAAIGGDDAAALLALYRAGRAAAEPNPMRMQTDNLATALLAAPLPHGDLRAAARAALPLLDEWVECHRALNKAMRDKQKREWDRHDIQPEEADAATREAAEKAVVDATQAIAAAQARLDHAEAAIATAVEAAIGAPQRELWRALAKWNALPRSYLDPRPLWRFTQALPDRVPPERRDAIATAASAILRRALERTSAASDAALPLLGASPREASISGVQSFYWEVQAAAFAQLWTLLPSDSSLADTTPSPAQTFLPELQRLRDANAAAPTSPAPSGPR